MAKQDVDRIRVMGHRAFVGGDGKFWDEIAKHQYDFLISEGLKPEHVLLDVACGSLRAGRLFIKHLAPGNYLGLDKEIDLIIRGVADELGIDAFAEKRPVFVISENFEFFKFSKQPDYILAQSLFSHLTPAGIYECLKALRQFITGKTVFYATFFESLEIRVNPSNSDSLDNFFYTRDQMNILAELSGWKMHYIGDWNHPRGQKIVKLEPNH